MVLAFLAKAMRWAKVGWIRKKQGGEGGLQCVRDVSILNRQTVNSAAPLFFGVVCVNRVQGEGNTRIRLPMDGRLEPTPFFFFFVLLFPFVLDLTTLPLSSPPLAAIRSNGVPAVAGQDAGGGGVRLPLPSRAHPLPGRHDQAHPRAGPLACACVCVCVCVCVDS